jgi:transcriptional regulator with XRE-family HTH domain
MSVRKKLRSKRQELGYSQQYMASRLGITQQAYSKIEKEPSKSSLEVLLRIAHFLDLDNSVLIGSEDHTAPNKYLGYLNDIDKKLNAIQNELKILKKKCS